MFLYKVGWMNKMCYGKSTGAIRRLAYEMVEKNNIKDTVMRYNNVGF